MPKNLPDHTSHVFNMPPPNESRKKWKSLKVVKLNTNVLAKPGATHEDGAFRNLPGASGWVGLGSKLWATTFAFPSFTLEPQIFYFTQIA